jgi:hypothetical protein
VLGRSLALLVPALLATGACVTRPVDSLPPDHSEQFSETVPARPNDQVDVLFLIDNSGSMASKQRNLGQNFANFVSKLRDGNGNLLDYRIAVVSTDVGVAGYPVDSSSLNLCNNATATRDPMDGDAGKLQTQIHTDVADWEHSNAGIFACGDDSLGIQAGNPDLCNDIKASRKWLMDNCSNQALDPSTPWIVNSKSMNRSDDDVATQFRCIGSLGINGCFIEQPLEAVKQGLEKNPTFIRPGALLAIIFVTDETDCSMSASGTALMDVSQGGFNAGTDANMRCYLDAYTLGGETMHTANVSGLGTFTYHAFTQQAENVQWLEPLQKYQDFFSTQLGKDPSQIIMGGIIANPDYTTAAAPPNGPGPQDASVKFVYEEQPSPSSGGDPYVIYSYSCSTPFGTGTPNPRLGGLLSAFADRATGSPAQVSICDDNYGPALDRFAGIIVTAIAACVDLAADAAGQDPNSVCLIDELGPDLSVRRSAIPASAGWSIIPDSPKCAGNPKGSYEVNVTPALRDSFATDSLLAVTCAAK